MSHSECLLAIVSANVYFWKRHTIFDVEMMASSFENFFVYSWLAHTMRNAGTTKNHDLRMGAVLCMAGVQWAPIGLQSEAVALKALEKSPLRRRASALMHLRKFSTNGCGFMPFSRTQISE
ncbi:MAG: hypothetical protein RR650_10605 [Comamonas sp.]|nr:hypothetical protein [Comamonas sp.]